jgi:hypothetical protein
MASHGQVELETGLDVGRSRARSWRCSAISCHPRCAEAPSAALQLFGDAGGALGPIVGTWMLGGTGALPYVATAAMLALVLPLGGWLAAPERAHGQ